MSEYNNEYIEPEKFYKLEIDRQYKIAEEALQERDALKLSAAADRIVRLENERDANIKMQEKRTSNE